jgi:ankyrin repeat protein
MKSLILVLLAPALFAQDPSAGQIRSVAGRSIALLQKGMTGFAKTQDCFSCHNTGLPAQAFELARRRGIPVDEAAARAALLKGLSRTPDLRSIDRVVQDTMIIDPAVSDGAALIAAHAAGLKPSPTTGVEARLIANAQRADGHWVTIDERPPQSHSEFTATALAIRAVQLYMPSELRQEASARAERAREWLLQATPLTTEDFTFRLFGLSWTGSSDSQRAAAVRDLTGMQRANGGWAQLPRMEPDAYATAEVLVALNEAGGIETSDPAWRKGLKYVVSTQNPDGSWRVRSRMVSPAHVSPPYFESGFPFGHDQFISSAATSYAAMALMLALPEASTPAPAPGMAELEPKGEKPWMRTALFGTAAELKSLLDGGLDPKSHTEGGTNLLMMAAPDLAKLKLLLDRGVDVNTKAKSGYTALMVASLYRGSSEAVELLLSKGAQAAPGPGVMFNASPIFLATYAGEAGNISLLHAKGGDVNRPMLVLGAFSTSPLAVAISLDEVEVMKALIAAGADIREHEATDGMSLLHSAVLANRLGAAQLLIAAGAPVNDVDKHGYSPLLYASTVDFGDDRMVKLLLRAGANPKIRAKTGETALEQAKRFKYAHIQTALETVDTQR